MVMDSPPRALRAVLEMAGLSADAGEAGAFSEAREAEEEAEGKGVLEVLLGLVPVKLRLRGSCDEEEDEDRDVAGVRRGSA